MRLNKDPGTADVGIAKTKRAGTLATEWLEGPIGWDRA